MNSMQPRRRWLGAQLSVAHLDRAIADKVPNAADSLPYPLPTEPDHFGATARMPGRMPAVFTPTRIQGTKPPSAIGDWLFAIALGIAGALAVFTWALLP